ncbi:hypothetical protein J3A83DRAFT_1725550 [Scleroderma citrinum]
MTNLFVCSTTLAVVLLSMLLIPVMGIITLVVVVDAGGGGSQHCWLGMVVYSASWGSSLSLASWTLVVVAVIISNAGRSGRLLCTKVRT